MYLIIVKQIPMGEIGGTKVTNSQFVCHIKETETSMYRVAKSILRNDEDCADAVQTAILKAYDKLDTLKQEKFFRTWITRILINECYQILRNRRELVPYEEYMSDQENYLEYSEVFEALMELEDMYRIPFSLHYVEGYSTREIAKFLGISVSNVKIRLSRARIKLQQRLEGEK